MIKVCCHLAPIPHSGNIHRSILNSSTSNETENTVTTENETPDENEANDTSSPETSEVAGEQPGEQQPDLEEELPEYEPLTPELVEDEAIRGDFMIRWVVVLLAVLLACVSTIESATLIHIRSGQTIMANGYWPPATDTLSSTAEGQPWYNLSWLFDLSIASLYNIGGPILITLAKAILVGVSFWTVVQTSKRGVSTWWGSVCAVLALLACYPYFSAEPVMITICGVGILFYLLNRWQESEFESIPWAIVALMCVWSNLDPRMYLGLGLVVLFAIGRTVGGFLNSDDSSASASTRPVWILTGLCIVASLVNPFLWRSLLSPLALYGSELPGWQTLFSNARGVTEVGYFPLTHSIFWENLNHSSLAGLMLIATAAVCMYLNRSRLDWGHLFVYIGFIGFSLLSSRDLGPTSVVCAVLATLNAQEWYRNSFRQTYSIETSELIFTRGGRAVTVVALAGLAYLAVGSRLSESPWWQVGFGFHEQLQNEIDAVSQSMEESFDDRPFHFGLRQGDLLVWVGKKSFIDSRLSLFTSDTPSVLDKFLQARSALFLPLTQSEVPKTPEEAEQRSRKWKDILDEYKIAWAVASLHGIVPDYLSHFSLMVAEQEWKMVGLGPYSSTYCRLDVDRDGMEEYRDKLTVDFLKQAFKDDIESKDIAVREDWAQPATFYQKYLTRARSPMPNPIRQALHYREYFRLADRGGLQLNPRLSIALSHLIIRNVNAGLVDDFQQADGYRALGAAYEILRLNESEISRLSGGGYSSERRFYQAVQALSQALVIEPNHLATRRYLQNIYVTQRRVDLVLRELKRIKEIQSKAGISIEENVLEQDRQREESLTAALANIRGQIGKLLEQNPDYLRAANLAYRNGCTLYALELLNQDPNLLLQNPRAQLLQAALLMESGQGDQAYQILGKLEGVAEQASFREWRTPAALSSLGHGEYSRANSIWTRDALDAERSQMTAAMQTLPFIGRQSSWPMNQTRSAASVLDRLPRRSAQQWFNVALNALESGETSKAGEHLKHMIEIFPETELRPLVQFYLYQVTDELIDLTAPSDWIPVDNELYPDPNQKLAEVTTKSPSPSGTTNEPAAKEITTPKPLTAPLPQ